MSSVKTTTYICNRFETSFCARDHKANQAISNLKQKFWNKSALIWVGFLDVCFYCLCSNETTSFKNDAFIWIPMHILYLVYTASLTDLCFNKKFKQKKNIYVEVFLNQFMLILIIYSNSNWMRCLVTFNKIFFLHKKVVVLRL